MAAVRGGRVTSEAVSSVAVEQAEVTAPSAPPRLPAKARRANPFFAFRGDLSRGAYVATAIIASLAVLAIWELSTRLGWINAIFLPPPSTTFATLWNMVLNKNLLMHAGISTLRVWAAFLLSVVMAVPIGIAMSSFRGVGAALEPIVDFIRYLPVPALVPLSIIWFGVGEETKIFLLWLGTFFQLVLLVADDMRRVPQEYVEIAYTVGARPRQMLTDVAFRTMLPSLFDNLRITLGWCWTYLIIAEIVAADKGLGFVIWAARRYMNTNEVMAGVVAIGLIGLFTDQMLRLLHKRLFRYL
jgi:NitT/TauT family transport system permease protein